MRAGAGHKRRWRRSKTSSRKSAGAAHTWRLRRALLRTARPKNRQSTVSRSRAPTRTASYPRQTRRATCSSLRRVQTARRYIHVGGQIGRRPRATAVTGASIWESSCLHTVRRRRRAFPRPTALAPNLPTPTSSPTKPRGLMSACASTQMPAGVSRGERMPRWMCQARLGTRRVGCSRSCRSRRPRGRCAGDAPASSWGFNSPGNICRIIDAFVLCEHMACSPWCST
mmetsp:Transcript_24646/g.75137  ORF Transcript_24646/g.75137 Transcript_24646/m.75137 type:complete len:227 (+) Transcript_24646:512-1192(+)